MGREEVIERAGEGNWEEKKRERGIKGEEIDGRIDDQAWCYSVFGSSFSASAASSGVFSTSLVLVSPFSDWFSSLD